MRTRAGQAALRFTGSAAIASAAVIFAGAAPLNETMPATENESNQQVVCPDYPFAFECDGEHCCASYNQRFLFFLFTLTVLGVALIVLGVILVFEMRPSKRALRSQLKHQRRDTRRPSEIEVRSNEETKYLRRMSELNPNAKRLCGE